MKVRELNIYLSELQNAKFFIAPECIIYPFETDLHPIIVLSNSSSLIYPVWPETVLRFRSGQSLDFICPNRDTLINSTATGNTLLTGTCVSGTQFQIGDQLVEWAALSCSDTHWRDIERTGETCAGDGIELEVGFHVEDGRFIQSMIICFNPNLQIAYYTYIYQTASINQRVLGTPRPSWLQGSGIYNGIGTVTNLYIRANQRASINSLLGLNDTSSLYIHDDTNYFLARGHMTARSDGYYAVQQNATFYMQNIAPQWQTFNGWNWNQIEIDLRDYASDNGLDLHVSVKLKSLIKDISITLLKVWTGVYGVSTLPHAETGEPTELYLFHNSTHKLLPVPEIYWKVAYDPISELGIALIGINNPYNSTFNYLCFDVSNRLTWLHCDRNNQVQGYCYACSITTLRYVVDFIPNVNERGLLL